MEKPATIIDIAKALNISPSTVSRSLNNHPSISNQTKKEVLSLAKKLNYQPNLTALKLLNKKSGTIGVIVPEITGYFFSMIITGMQDIVSSLGYKLLISQTNESFEEEEKLIQEMIISRVEGVLISPSHQTNTFEHFKKLEMAGIPMVMFDRDCSGYNCNKVIVDIYTGAIQAMNYLINKGCKNIAHIAGPINIDPFKQRLNAYYDALNQHQIEVVQDLIVNSHGFGCEDGVMALEELVKRKTKFDAIFCLNDATAFGVMHSLRERRYKVPEDVAIVGYDDEPYASFFSPSLTTIWQPVYDMGLLSSKILLDLINNKGKTKSFRFEILKTELIIRES